ncbi:hypothetical protein MRX96_046838 [Rhipicephalus microplus]
MAWKFLLIFVAVAYYITLLFSLPPVDNEVAMEVIFGKGDGTSVSRLPPLFAHGGVSRYAPEFTLDSIQAAREAKAAGIELTCPSRETTSGCSSTTTTSRGRRAARDSWQTRLSLTCDKWMPQAMIRFPRNAATALTFRHSKKASMSAFAKDCGSSSMSKGTMTAPVALLGVLFSQWPELYRLGLVSSPNADFIYALRLKYPDIVTALTWRPGLLAYEDPERRRPRYESLNKHYKAVIARTGFSSRHSTPACFITSPVHLPFFCGKID